MCILSGCDYLAPLGGIGLKTLHKYFLKYKTLDRVLCALRRESNKLITKDYETEFLKAELTFQHQTVYCPIEKCSVNLNPIPENITLNMEIETDEAFSDLNFLGPKLNSELSQGIAEGRINPITFKSFLLEEPSTSRKENIRIKEAPAKLKNLLMKTKSDLHQQRLTLQRVASYSSTQSSSESIQNSLRSKFIENVPKYSNIRKPTATTLNKKTSGKQFSILNFCVPKSSFNTDESK